MWDGVVYPTTVLYRVSFHYFDQFAASIFHDLLLDQAGRSIGFPEPLSVPSASWLAFRYFELNLTPDDAPTYHSLRPGEVNLVVEGLCAQRNRKRRFL
jgi:hypothetical protein